MKGSVLPVLTTLAAAASAALAVSTMRASNAPLAAVAALATNFLRVNVFIVLVSIMFLLMQQVPCALNANQQANERHQRGADDAHRPAGLHSGRKALVA